MPNESEVQPRVLLRHPEVAADFTSLIDRLTKVGDTARNAICSTRTSSFDLDLPRQGARSVSLHFALRRPSERDRKGGADVARRKKRQRAPEVTFRISQVGAAAPLLERVVSEFDEEWNAHRIELPQPVAGKLDTLRFEVVLPELEDPPEACWASIVVDGEPSVSAEGARPHVILISLDTLGASHLSSFAGAPETSPAIDDFLANSFSFRRGYAPYGNTLTSHSSLFSASYPRRNGRYTLLTPLDSLATEFARNGYRTVAFTEVGFVRSDFGFAQGFDFYVDGNGKGTPGMASETFARAASWITENASGAPFFLFLHTYEVHVPYQIRNADARRFAEELADGSVTTFSTAAHLRMTTDHNTGASVLPAEKLSLLEALYRSEIRELDREFEGFLRTLEEAGVRDEVLIVLISDHGELFGEEGKIGHGSSLHNRGLHVPVAFQWRGRLPIGESTDAVSLIDVLPTVFDLLGFDSGPFPDGVSLADSMRNPEARTDEERIAIAEGRVPYPCETGRCATRRVAAFNQHYKLERDLDRGTQRFFDLREDPMERQECGHEHPDRVRRLERAIDEYLAIEEPGPLDRLPIEVTPEAKARLRALGYLE